MALKFSSSSKVDDIPTLLAKKNYARAIEQIKVQLQKQRNDPRLRLQLADVLVLMGKTREATAVLLPLAEEYARDGFAAKAISVLKKVQKIDPSLRDVDGQLASLIAEKQQQAVVVAPSCSPTVEWGMEEFSDAGDEIDLGQSVAPNPTSSPMFVEPEKPEPLLPVSPVLVVDQDLIVEDQDSSLGEEPMTEAGFADELLSLVEGAFGEGSGAFDATNDDVRPSGGSQIVVSPLFKDFSVDEMVAVIQGLTLHAFPPGEVILLEGEIGESLYMLTSGVVEASKADPNGALIPLARLQEGAFFGEGAILTREPRNATVTAVTSCELLELDRETLDRITAGHPHVWTVLEEFAAQRRASRSY